jgi:hypothetical protein
MTIRLISPDERFETKILDCTFYYRRLPDDEDVGIHLETPRERRARDRGVVDDKHTDLAAHAMRL